MKNNLNQSKFIDQYLDLINTQFKGLNLTRIINKEDFELLQWKDSLTPIEFLPGFRELVSKSSCVVDFGCGGGFPIIPLSAEFPGTVFVGIDKRRKKILALREISGKMGLKNNFFFHYLIQELVFDLPCIILIKAVGKITDCLKLIKSCHPGTSVIFYKGAHLDEKERDYESKLPKDWMLSQKINFKLENHERVLLQFNRVKTSIVPRGTQTKQILLSTILRDGPIGP